MRLVRRWLFALAPNEAGIVAVIGHEIGHMVKNDPIERMHYSDWAKYSK